MDPVIKQGIVRCSVRNCSMHYHGPVMRVYAIHKSGLGRVRRFDYGHPDVTPNQVLDLLESTPITGVSLLTISAGSGVAREEWEVPDG